MPTPICHHTVCKTTASHLNLITDLRKDKTVIPKMKVNDCILDRVSCYKRFGLWIDHDLKRITNTEIILRKAAKRLWFLKIRRGYTANSIKVVL